ncbi:DUF4272 domain-containing protein [Paenibacillus sp. 2TAB19]|uniref:DUF4272 domain-containing protein n=1 Tax=Paenibacillus sp. 2TAB19 TaxID=3233003 RepID=UPI003F9CEE93
MKNCAIYSSNFDLNQVLDLIKALYPKDSIQVTEDGTNIQVTRKKWFAKTVNRFTIMTSHTQPDEFAKMINGMGNFFAQLQAKNSLVHEKLLIKISTLNMVIGIETEEEISDAFYKELLSIAERLDGPVFWGSRQLLHWDGKLLMDLDGNSEVNDFKVTAHTSLLHGDLKETETALSRKKRSERILTERGIPFNKNLPAALPDEGACIQSVDDITKRAVALCIVALKGECVGSGESEEDTDEVVDRVTALYGASDFFSPLEKAFIRNRSPKIDEAAPFSWRYEGYLVMLWALGFVQKLDEPTGVCDVGAAVSILKRYDSFEAFKSSARLRSVNEILDAADLIYRYNWVCVDSRINDSQTPGDLDNGVVYERHYALNWLIRYKDQPWDEIKTDT